jgi:class 3 adenylate cyclase
LASRTLTVVFTDLADYTASVGRIDREGLRNLVATHEQSVAPVLERHGGRIVKGLGDSFMAVFPAATDAVKACIELVDAVEDSDIFSIRGAMATGDVEEIDGDCFGEAVNLAARILSKAPSGEIWMSEATLGCMNQAEIPWESIGRFPFKGFPGEQAVYRAVPSARAWLPQTVVKAARSGQLIRLGPGDRPSQLPPEPTVLLEGFEFGSDGLNQVLAALPVIDQARIWIQCYRIPPIDRHEWTSAGRGLIVAKLASLERAVDETVMLSSRRSGTDTIILDSAGASDVDLVMAGLALPSVPMSDVVAGYTYDLLKDGRWVNKSEGAVARIEVSAGEVRVAALAPGVTVAGARLPIGESIRLRNGDSIDGASCVVRYVAVQDSNYSAVLLAETATRVGMAQGSTFEIGREPQHPGLALPDRRSQDNIRWCVGGRASRAREGGFTLDRALAGRRQASVVFRNGEAQLEGLHKSCPTYRLREDDLSRVDAPMGIAINDMIVVGTSVIALRAPQD